jgi:ribosomal protein S18 acetylase RimI-like enzyme
MEIRPLRQSDREPIRRVLMETGVFTEEEVAIALELVDVVLGKPGQRDYVIRVCGDGDIVRGYYCVGPTPATEGTFDLYWIAVQPEVHGMGIGGILNAHAEEYVKSNGGRLIIVETSSRPHYEKTRAFYQRRGYRELSRIKDYYRPGDDLVVYGKYLS